MILFYLFIGPNIMRRGTLEWTIALNELIISISLIAITLKNVCRIRRYATLETFEVQYAE